MQVRQIEDEIRRKHIKEINAQTKSLLRHLLGEKPISLLMNLNYQVPNASIFTNFLEWLSVQNSPVDQ